MKKKIWFISMTVIVAMLISFSISASGRISKEKALLMFQDSQEIFQVSQEVFEKEIEERDPGMVMFASSIYSHFQGVTMEDIYALYDELGSSQEVIEYLLTQDNIRIRRENQTKGMTEEEKQAARDEYESLVLSGQTLPFLSDDDIKNIKDTSEYTALFEYELAPFRFAYKSAEELKYYMNVYTPGATLFIGNLAKSCNCPIEEAFKLYEEFDNDLNKTYEYLTESYYNQLH